MLYICIPEKKLIKARYRTFSSSKHCLSKSSSLSICACWTFHFKTVGINVELVLPLLLQAFWKSVKFFHTIQFIISLWTSHYTEAYCHAATLNIHLLVMSAVGKCYIWRLNFNYFLVWNPGGFRIKLAWLACLII